VEPSVGQELLTLRAPGMPALELPVGGRAGPERPVTVWKDSCRALDQGEDAAQWFSEYLGQPARLVRIGAGYQRAVDAAIYPEGADVSFADGYPLLVLSAASLADLNGRLVEPLPMNRFRPNVVIEGCPAFAEDVWTRIRIGQVTLHLTTLCKRCAIPTINQSTAVQGKEPSATLAQFRLGPEGGVFFGRNAVHATPGSLRVGDAVEVLS
jgi:uncharacterized protein